MTITIEQQILFIKILLIACILVFVIGIIAIIKESKKIK